MPVAIVVSQENSMLFKTAIQYEVKMKWYDTSKLGASGAVFTTQDSEMLRWFWKQELTFWNDVFIDQWEASKLVNNRSSWSHAWYAAIRLMRGAVNYVGPALAASSCLTPPLFSWLLAPSCHQSSPIQIACTQFTFATITLQLAAIRRFPFQRRLQITVRLTRVNQHSTAHVPCTAINLIRLWVK